MKKIGMIGLAAVLGLGTLAGCSESEKSSQQGTTITVCVEEYQKQTAENLIKAWEKQQKGIRVELTVLPKKDSEAETRISEMRTEIMSGEGPDVFILSGTSPDVAEQTYDLFLNPEKLMHSEVFLPLDEYMKETEYVKADELNEKILKAGRTKEGQMILPLYYTYKAYAFPADAKDIEQKLPADWEKLMEVKDPYVLANLWGRITLSLQNAFGALADYEKEELLFSEGMLLKQVENIIAFAEAGRASAYISELVPGGSFCRDVMPFLELEKGQPHKLWAIPNMNGGITANVTLYGAVNRNTEYPEEAFSLLDFLLSDEIMSGRGIPTQNGEIKMMEGNMFAVYQDGFPVNDTALEERFAKINPEDAKQIRKIHDNIDTARCYSDLESEIFDMFSDIFYERMEADISSMVHERYEKMQMSVSE